MEIQCLCEHKFEVTPIVKIDLDASKDSLERIKDGSFNSFKCPKCGFSLRAESKVELSWQSKKTSLVFIPESKRIYGLQICSGEKLKDDPENNDFSFDKKTPLVIGFPEFVDRVKILDADLDPICVEVVKFIVIQNAEPVDKNSLDIFFSKLEDEKLEFLISGLKKDEVAVIKIPKKIYDNLLSDYKKHKKNELFSAVSVGNYVSYKNIYMEGDTDNEDD